MPGAGPGGRGGGGRPRSGRAGRAQHLGILLLLRHAGGARDGQGGRHLRVLQDEGSTSLGALTPVLLNDK